MASVMSTTEAKAQLQAGVKILDDLDTGAMGDFATNYDSILNGLAGDVSDEVLAGVRRLRDQVAGAVTPELVQAVLDPISGDFMLAINKPVGPFEQNVRELVEWMESNSETFNSGNVTHGTPSAGGSNTGTGTMHRCTVSKYGYELEAIHAETKTFECISDGNTGDRYRERFRVIGQRALKDSIEIQGTGLYEDGLLRALNADNSLAFLTNVAWRATSGSPTSGSPLTPSPVTDIAGWTLANLNAELDVDTVFRGSPNITTPVSLRFTDNNSIAQTFRAARAARINSDRPILLQVPVYRESSCDGTFRMTLGGRVINTTMSGLTNGAWNVVTAALDENSYYDQWASDGAQLKLELTGRSTGTIYLSQPVMAYMTLIDGAWYAIVGGATDFLRGDTFSTADSYGTRGKIKYWLEYRSGLQAGLTNEAISAPSDNAGTETIADPS